MRQGFQESTKTCETRRTKAQWEAEEGKATAATAAETGTSDTAPTASQPPVEATSEAGSEQ